MRIHKLRTSLFLVALVSFGFFLLKGAPVGLLDKLPYFSQEKNRVQEEINAKLKPVQLGGAFSLRDQSGHLVTSESLRGHFLLINFGYSACPGICITNTQTMIAALKKLGKDAERVIPIFITFDPERDTPEQLTKYIKMYHYPRLLALTGSPKDIREVAQAYKVFYEAEEHASGEDYMIDHSALIYLMGTQGEALTLFPPHTDPAKMAEKIATYLHGSA